MAADNGKRAAADRNEQQQLHGSPVAASRSYHRPPPSVVVLIDSPVIDTLHPWGDSLKNTGGLKADNDAVMVIMDMMGPVGQIPQEAASENGLKGPMATGPMASNCQKGEKETAFCANCTVSSAVDARSWYSLGRPARGPG